MSTKRQQNAGPPNRQAHEDKKLARAARRENSAQLFWRSLRVAVNAAYPGDVTLTGHVRSRSLRQLEGELEHRMASAVQDADAGEYFRAASLKAVFAKYSGVSSPQGKEVALQSWLKAEGACRRANRRIWLTVNSSLPIGKQHLPILRKARRIIHRVLGRFDFTEMVESCRHGPGVALGCSGLATSGAFKYASREYTVSPSCALLFRDTVLTDKTWLNFVTKHRTKLTVVDDCDVLKFVPKNWKTDRTISVGPLGNTYMQLGVGEMISARLKRVGIDLSTQENNQQAAFEASKLNGDWGDGYVTLDLSMASDTLSRELVRYFLPEDWYRVLDALRCQATKLPDGSVVRLSKFSAMGNGFTFPLETLVFYALSQAVMSCTSHYNRIWVYGDDIIVPRGCALLLSEVLRWCGFSINHEKSFIHGEFYESCGADYLGGIPVRPVYWKRRLLVDRDLYVLVNGYGFALSVVPHSAWLCDLRDHLLRSCRSPILYGPPVVRAGSSSSFPDDRVVTDDRRLYTMKRVGDVLLCKVYNSRPGVQPVLDDFAFLQARHGLKRLGQGATVVEREPDRAIPGARRLVPIRTAKSTFRYTSVS